MENKYGLNGTEKQIAWASDILDDVLGTIERNIEVNRERDQKKETKAFEIIKETVLKIIAKQKEAAIYIKNRHKLNPNTVIKSAEEIRSNM